MKKLFFSFVVLISLVFLWFKADIVKPAGLKEPEKLEILRFALVSDSEDDNEELEKALLSAKTNGANFVIGLGDFTKLGMIDNLSAAKAVFEKSGVRYYVTAGDRDLWDSRDKGKAALDNFNEVFGKSTHVINSGEVSLIIVDNSDIYKGISEVDWDILNSAISSDAKLKLVLSHKTPYHPQTAHIMGADRESVAKQAKDYINLLEAKKIGGFFSGDIHFYAKYNSPNNVFKMNTIGAVNRERNFQGPSYTIIKIYNDYTWESESIDL